MAAGAAQRTGFFRNLPVGEIERYSCPRWATDPISFRTTAFSTVFWFALASADTFAARLRFGRFIGMVSAEENTYFLRAFEALGVTETRRAADPDTQPTIAFKAIMRVSALLILPVLASGRPSIATPHTRLSSSGANGRRSSTTSHATSKARGRCEGNPRVGPSFFMSDRSCSLFLESAGCCPSLDRFIRRVEYL